VRWQVTGGSLGFRFSGDGGGGCRKRGSSGQLFIRALKPFQMFYECIPALSWAIIIF
jgi:hypothetical protein